MCTADMTILLPTQNLRQSLDSILGVGGNHTSLGVLTAHSRVRMIRL